MKKGIRRYFIILIVIIVCIVTLVDCTNTQTRREERTSASHLHHEAEPGLTQWVLNKYSHRMNTL